jgi:hypothetical protein
MINLLVPLCIFGSITGKVQGNVGVRFFNKLLVYNGDS